MPKNKKQNLKTFYIADFLMSETDGELDEKGRPLHGVYVKDIQEYLLEKGIEAEAHSISRDIDLLGGVWKGREGKTEKFKPILSISGGNGKPYYIDNRMIPFSDVETIAECIASANFISKNDAADLIEELKILCSWAQARRLKKDYLVADRSTRTQKKMLDDLADVRAAVKEKKKISFYYTKRNTENIDQITRRMKNKRYTVSPFKVVLSEGRHYLVGYDDTYHQMRAYRIDRMEVIEKKDEPVEGIDKYKRMRINDYAKQTFGMFIGGEADYITIRFENALLDAMYDRFGNRADTIYKKVDDEHFTVKTLIVRSENFYGWICGFGGRAVIIDPPETVELFKNFLKKIEEKS